MHTLNDDVDYIQFIGTQESQYIIKPSELKEDVLSIFTGAGDLRGDILPWSKTHNYVKLRPGEVTVWAGINGHGKSQLLGQVCAWGLKHSKWLIASMEMKPSRTMHRMVRQVSGTSNTSESFVNKFLDWTDDRLWIYDQTDTVKAERILGMVHYAAKELGINHIIIDSLMKCGIRKDDMDGQAAFVDRLCWAAKSNNIHIHLVHHMRKGERESNVPDKFDVRGAGEITDLVDNVFIVHRNKAKEIKAAAGNADPTEPDCVLKIAKQRNGEWEKSILLWFNQDSLQYVGDNTGRIMAFH